MTQDELLAELEQIKHVVTSYASGLSEDEFFRGSDEVWSASHTLSHLDRSQRMVAYTFSLPRDRLKPNAEARPSRSLEQLKADYLARLADGVKSFGRYDPEPHGTQAEQIEEYNDGLDGLKHHVSVYTEEAELDRFLLLHPALGDLTLREMLEFTVYHNQHHLEIMKRRLENYD